MICAERGMPILLAQGQYREWRTRRKYRYQIHDIYFREALPLTPFRYVCYSNLSCWEGIHYQYRPSTPQLGVTTERGGE